MKGLFVTLEGGEGTGKTTQMALLCRRIQAAGRGVTQTREPGGTGLGRTIRQLLVQESDDPPTPLAELLLYAADRAHHVATVIRPALAEGRVVVCDRYADATEVYQGCARGIPQDVVRRANDLATGGLWPHRTVVLDLEAVSGVARALSRETPGGAAKEARFESENLDFHEKVRAGYRAVALREPDRVRVVDAAGAPEEVAVRVWDAVKDLFALEGPS